MDTFIQLITYIYHAYVVPAFPGANFDLYKRFSDLLVVIQANPAYIRLKETGLLDFFIGIWTFIIKAITGSLTSILEWIQMFLSKLG